MPHVMEKFEYWNRRNGGGGRRFEAQLDGQIWMFTKEEIDELDFANARSFIAAVKSEAKRFMNRYVRACQLAEGGAVISYSPRTTSRDRWLAAAVARRRTPDTARNRKDRSPQMSEMQTVTSSPRRTRRIAGPSLQIAKKDEGPKGLKPIVPAVLEEMQALKPRILAIVRGHGDGISFRAVAQALGRKSGQAHASHGAVPHSRLTHVLSAMCLSRELVRVIRQHEIRYRLPTADEEWGSPVRRIPIPRFRRTAFRRAVHAILAGRPRGCVLSELVNLAHEESLYATTETVTEALDALIRRGDVRAVPFGAFCRYEAVRAS